MWICKRCIIRLLDDSKDLDKYFTPACNSGKCEKCKDNNIVVDWLGEVDLSFLESKRR